jgi:hypothetical protein
MSAIESSKKSSKTVVYEVKDFSATPPSSGEGEWSSSVEAGSLDKVREILFGAQSREFEKRVALLENRLLQESGELRQELIKSLDDLKAHIKQEVQGLVGKLEEGQRVTTMQEIGQNVKTIESQLSQQISELTQQSSNQFRTMGLEMQRQKEGLIEQHQQALNQMETQLQQAVKELKMGKTDRAALAEMLMDVALRLKVGPSDTETS